MIRAQVTEIALDEDSLMQAIEQGERSALRKFGFGTRSIAKESIVPGNGPSAPGSPPHDQTGILRRFIRYSVTGKTVVVGPKLLERRSRGAVRALESGGVSRNWRGRVQRVKRRPFMLPAFFTMQRQIPRQFENSIKKGV